MNPGLRASASGMRAQQTRIDAIANNLANVNTTAFKRSRTNFEDMLYETLQGSQLVHYEGTETLAPIQIGRGVRLADIQRIHTQGTFEQTDNPFDLAIEGDGFFQIQLPNGNLAYTRDGTFTRAADTGALVTHAGFQLEPEITIPPEAVQVTISPTGQVSGILGNGGQQVDLGQIELVRFVNPSGLLSLGGNNYAATPASGDPMTGAPMEDGFGQIQQGSLETSNVEIVQEMVDMIAAQRAYEVNSKAIKTAEEMIQTVTSELIR
jgi:flagellar basal-body rod protein FlgG